MPRSRNHAIQILVLTAMTVTAGAFNVYDYHGAHCFVAACRLDIRHWCAADRAEEHTSELVKRKRAAMFRDELGGSFATGRSRDIHRRGVDRTSFQWPRRCLPAAPE